MPIIGLLVVICDFLGLGCDCSFLILCWVACDLLCLYSGGGGGFVCLFGVVFWFARFEFVDC